MQLLIAPEKRPRIIALLTALTLIAAVGVGSTAAQQNDTEAVRSVLLQEAAAFERGDLDALNKLWAHDDSVIVIENGHANYGWADYRDNHLAPEMKAMKNVKFSFTDIKVRLAGNTAWATFKYTISADLKERHVEGNSLATAILEKRDGRWLIVHWHSSSPRRPPAANPAKPN